MRILGILLIVIGISALAMLFMIFPALRRHPERESFSGKFIAHRGLHGTFPDGRGGSKKVPENSLEAFRLAAERGLPIETDIHLTADGRLAVMHDNTLERMCGVKRRPENMTMEELGRLRLAGTRERVPSLEEVLELVDGRVPLLIELKCSDRETCEKLCAAADKVLDGYDGSFAVQSFYTPAVAWFRRHRPEVMRGQLASGMKGGGLPGKLAGMLLVNVSGRPDFISYKYTRGRNFFFRLCALLGALPLGWTFRDRDSVAEYGRYFRGYIFENEETIL